MQRLSGLFFLANADDSNEYSAGRDICEAFVRYVASVY